MTGDLLRRAADRLDVLAAENPHLPIVGGTPAWNPWTAAMGPQVAAPLAAWLRNTAEWVDADEPCPRTEAAALARLILGEPDA